MAEYIKRETLKEHLYGGKFQEGCAGRDEPGEGCIECIVDEIDNFPAADVAPVRRGFWIIGGIVPAKNVIGNWKCSLCNGTSLHNSDYCPNCGAKMEVPNDD